MFELIGIVVSIWVVWVIVKSVIKGSVKGHQLRTIHKAVDLGVPRDFAKFCIENINIIKMHRSELARNNNEFKMLDVYLQNAFAIKQIYDKSRTISKEEEKYLKIEIVNLLKPQFDKLKNEGFSIYLNSAAYAYVYALGTAISEKIIELELVRDIFNDLLPEDDHSFTISNSFQVIARSSDFDEYCRDLLPIVLKEIESKSFTYIYKQIKKCNKTIEMMSENDFDPREISRKDIINVD